MIGGVRHLVWDFGHCMEPAQRINMARFTLVGSIVLTALIWARRLFHALTGGPCWSTTGLIRAAPCGLRSPGPKGLAAAGHGAGHWWVHRMTAVSNVPLIIAFVIIVAALAGSSYEQALGIVSHPFVALVLILPAAISVTNHMRLGMQLPIEDYIHQKGWKLSRPSSPTTSTPF